MVQCEAANLVRTSVDVAGVDPRDPARACHDDPRCSRVELCVEGPVNAALAELSPQVADPCPRRRCRRR
jgi:hypothetical protein